jgi:hypothetical protein
MDNRTKASGGDRVGAKNHLRGVGAGAGVLGHTTNTTSRPPAHNNNNMAKVVVPTKISSSHHPIIQQVNINGNINGNIHINGNGNIRYETYSYSCTTSLLVVIHVLFVVHCWKRTSRRKLLVNYKRIIQQKHYYTALGALLSHAPTTKTEEETIPTPTTTTTRSSSFLPSWCHDCYYRSSPSSFFLSLFSSLTNGNPLSGLPLLFYNAHLLWSCRALEVELGDGGGNWQYARILWALTWTALGMDLWCTYCVLTMIRGMHHGTSTPFSMGASWATNTRRSTTTPRRRRPVVQGGRRRQVEQLLCHRSIGSLTLTTSAVLVLFRDRFPLEPLQILPFLRMTHTTTITSATSATIALPLSLLSIPAVSYSLCLIILLVLAHPSHPIASVACGTLAGVLWTAEWTSFLIEPYWSNGSLVAYIGLCLLSIKASSNNNTSSSASTTPTTSRWIPCIEHVAWNSKGRLLLASSSLLVLDDDDSNNNNYEPGNNDDNDGGEEDSSTGTNSDSSSLLEAEQELPMVRSDLRHRLPQMGNENNNDNEHEQRGEDEEGNEQRPLMPRSASTTMRSRRTRRV